MSDAGSDELHDELQDWLHDEFLGALSALGVCAGNGRLRALLEWQESACDSVKAQLLRRRLVVPGRGRGGSVALVAGDESSGSGIPMASR